MKRRLVSLALIVSLAFSFSCSGNGKTSSDAIFTDSDYMEMFSDDLKFSWDYMYWSAQASLDVYHKRTDTLKALGFTDNLKTIESNSIQIAIGSKAVNLKMGDREITRIVAIAIKGTSINDWDIVGGTSPDDVDALIDWLRNVFADTDTYPATWLYAEKTKSSILDRHDPEILVPMPSYEYQGEPQYRYLDNPLVHTGILNAYRELKFNIVASPFKAESPFMWDKNTAYWISGHSLGGAVGELLTLDLIQSGLPAENVVCFNIGGVREAHESLVESAEHVKLKETDDVGVNVRPRFFYLYNDHDRVTVTDVMGGMTGTEYEITYSSLSADVNARHFDGETGSGTLWGHSLPKIYIPYIECQLQKDNADNPDQGEDPEIALLPQSPFVGNWIHAIPNTGEQGKYGVTDRTLRMNAAVLQFHTDGTLAYFPGCLNTWYHLDGSYEIQMSGYWGTYQLTQNSLKLHLTHLYGWEFGVTTPNSSHLLDQALDVEIPLVSQPHRDNGSYVMSVDFSAMVSVDNVLLDKYDNTANMKAFDYSKPVNFTSYAGGTPYATEAFKGAGLFAASEKAVLPESYNGNLETFTTTDPLRLRSGPDTKYPYSMTLARGSSVKSLAVNDGWHFVESVQMYEFLNELELDEKPIKFKQYVYGWVSGDYLSATE